MLSCRRDLVVAGLASSSDSNSNNKAVASFRRSVSTSMKATTSIASSMPPMPLQQGGRSLSTLEYVPIAEKALQYFDDSTDPFHAVQTSIDMLQKVGFESIDEVNIATKHTIQPGGKYYYTKNKSTLVAFAVGKKFQQPNDDSGNGFIIIGGHTDSPNLRVKPRSKRGNNIGGCIQIGVECYGGGLWNTWFDRDLGISGRVFVRNGQGKIEQKLIKINRALLRISNLAIHLQTADERKAFAVNSEEHLSPILAIEVQKALAGVGVTVDAHNNTDKDSTTLATTHKNDDGWMEYQEPALLHVLAHELQCATTDIIDFELCLFDVQKAALGGAFGEFIHSARLDNLASCFMAVQALMDYVNDDDGLLEESKDVTMIVLYDHEEVGSNSATGAASPILEEALESISEALLTKTSETGNDSSLAQRRAFLRKHSFVVSSDQAHAVHPNYASKHEKNHQPKLNNGMVIKRNTNQRYATTPLGGIILRQIAQKAKLPPLQEFIVRQDCGCGSTIGPTISARTGIRTIDMGCPQLSMHSIRETMGAADIQNGINLFKAYFRYFRDVDSSVEQ